jgi:hypothetical protein
VGAGDFFENTIGAQQRELAGGWPPTGIFCRQPWKRPDTAGRAGRGCAGRSGQTRPG